MKELLPVSPYHLVSGCFFGEGGRVRVGRRHMNMNMVYCALTLTITTYSYCSDDITTITKVFLCHNQNSRFGSDLLESGIAIAIIDWHFTEFLLLLIAGNRKNATQEVQVPP